MKLSGRKAAFLTLLFTTHAHNDTRNELSVTKRASITDSESNSSLITLKKRKSSLSINVRM